jgi:four helix bundle protein
MDESEHPFPAERLIVYQVAVRLQARVAELMPQFHRIKPSLAEQLDRAVDSIVLNIAEGATEFSVPEKRRFYRMALRSTGEAAAALRFFASRMGGLPAEMSMLHELIAMLTTLAKLRRD